MDLSAISRPDVGDLTYDWRSDLGRLGREVAMAEMRGRRDELTLAEIECSLDLVEADLASQKRSGGEAAARPLEETRTRLSSLAARLQRLPL